MLALCGAEWEGIPVDYYHGETRTPEWRARVSVMGEVPVVEHASRSHTQSGAILTWLSQHFGRFAAEDREEELRWLLFGNHKFIENDAFAYAHASCCSLCRERDSALSAIPPQRIPL